MTKSLQLVLVRHGESQWNQENRFTGWVDVDLSEKGVGEARAAGKALKESQIQFDLCFTSVLKRAIRTSLLALEELDLLWLPVERTWRLNERHYGALQGLNKTEMAQKYGEAQVHQWRRSFDIPPPPLEKFSPQYPGKDRRYAGLPENEIPLGESLKDTVARVVPYWNETLAPALKAGKNLLVFAHGNSLRALIKHLDQVSDHEIVGLNLPTGIPLVYELTPDLKPIRHYYLGDPAVIAKALEGVANQGKAKKD